MKTNIQTLARACTAVNTLFLLAFAYVFGLFPFYFVLCHLADPALREPGIPRAAAWVHQKLSPKHDAWARAREASNRAAQLTTEDLVETEWPLFGSAFYLWATEALENAHEENSPAVPTAPSEYASAAIASATDLILDPGHAAWVEQHWGAHYLFEENAFYRMLILSAAIAHENLTGSGAHHALIEQQATTLARELSASRHGLIEDYPGECYPGDVMAVLAAIRRSGIAIPGGNEAFLDRALRAFDPPAVDPVGLPPYQISARSGLPIGPSRGCSNSYLIFLAAEVDLQRMEEWYGLYETHFWQQRFGATGFREYPRNITEHDWELGDMDAGPIFGGFGMAASAFGLAAARSNGRYDHAYPLAAQMLAASWPLPNGTLLLPRILSDTVDAPYLGEAGILFNLTRQPATGVPIVTGGTLPPLVYAILAAYLGAALILIAAAAKRAWPLLQARDPHIHAPKLQVTLWAILLLSGLLLLITNHHAAGMILLIAAQVPPRAKF